MWKKFFAVEYKFYDIFRCAGVCGKNERKRGWMETSLSQLENKLLESKVELDEIILPYIRLDGYFGVSRYVARVEIEKGTTMCTCGKYKFSSSSKSH
jgi:hypothetical protein